MKPEITGQFPMTKEWRILSTLDDTCDLRAHLLRKAEWSAHVWRCHYWSRKTNDKWPLDPTTTRPHLSFPSCLETRTNPKRSSCFFRSPLTIALHVCKKSGKAWFGAMVRKLHKFKYIVPKKKRLSHEGFLMQRQDRHVVGIIGQESA